MSPKKRTTHDPAPEGFFDPKEQLLGETAARAIRAVTSPARAYAPEASREIWARAAAGDFNENEVLPFLQAVAQAILRGDHIQSAVGLYRDKARTWADVAATEFVTLVGDLDPVDPLPPIEAILTHLKADPRAAGLRASSLRLAAERARENARKRNSK